MYQLGFTLLWSNAGEETHLGRKGFLGLMVCGVRVGAMAGAALGRGSRSGQAPAHIWAGQEAKKRNCWLLLAAGLCWLSLSALLFWDSDFQAVSPSSVTHSQTRPVSSVTPNPAADRDGKQLTRHLSTLRICCVLLVTKL